MMLKPVAGNPPRGVSKDQRQCPDPGQARDRRDMARWRGENKPTEPIAPNHIPPWHVDGSGSGEGVVRMAVVVVLSRW